MNVTQRNLINEFLSKKITIDEFKTKFPISEMSAKQEILMLLNQAYSEKNANDIEDVLTVGYCFNIFDTNYTEILCNLLEANWHTQHEDIARVLQSLKDPKSIESLYNTINTRYDYLAYNDCYALIVKCSWALGDINTEASWSKLKGLSESDNEIIKEAALEQLKRREQL